MPSGILHQAVLKEDLATLRLMREDSSLKKEKDNDGYTAIELARYLDRIQCLKVLREWNPSKLKVCLRNDPTAQIELNEAGIAELLGFHYVPTLVFQTYDFFLETLANCPLTFKFHRKYLPFSPPDVVVKWIDETVGYGLFSEGSIPKGTIIGEYAGKVRRLYPEKPDPNGYCAHYPTKWWSRGTYTVIDAETEGNELRFINHNDKPNLKSAWAYDRGLMHLLFIVKQDISPGTQLTINYGPDYWQFRRKQTIVN